MVGISVGEQEYFFNDGDGHAFDAAKAARWMLHGHHMLRLHTEMMAEMVVTT